MSALTENSVASRLELRKFGLLVGLITPAIFSLILPFMKHASMPTWPWLIGGLLVGFGVLAPQLLRPIHLSWMRFGHVAGAINTRIVMFAVYGVLVVPFGLFMRARGRDILKCRSFRDSSGKTLSYKVLTASAPVDRAAFRRPF